VWEELKHSFAPGGVQISFNKALVDCDVVIWLFHTRVGEFTREEFDLALEAFNSDRKPYYIFAYFKNAPYDPDSITSNGFKQLEDLKEAIERERKMYMKFDFLADLKIKLKNQLAIIVEEVFPAKEGARGSLFEDRVDHNECVLNRLPLDLPQIGNQTQSRGITPGPKMAFRLIVQVDRGIRPKPLEQARAGVQFRLQPWASSWERCIPDP
jgi:hypothetical protein